MDPIELMEERIKNKRELLEECSKVASLIVDHLVEDYKNNPLSEEFKVDITYLIQEQLKNKGNRYFLGKGFEVRRTCMTPILTEVIGGLQLQGFYTRVAESPNTYVSGLDYYNVAIQIEYSMNKIKDAPLNTNSLESITLKVFNYLTNNYIWIVPTILILIFLLVAYGSIKRG